MEVGKSVWGIIQTNISVIASFTGEILSLILSGGQACVEFILNMVGVLRYIKINKYYNILFHFYRLYSSQLCFTCFLQVIQSMPHFRLEPTLDSHLGTNQAMLWKIPYRVFFFLCSSAVFSRACSLGWFTQFLEQELYSCLRLWLLFYQLLRSWEVIGVLSQLCVFIGIFEVASVALKSEGGR